MSERGGTRVAIVGGGLAGMAAAVALAEHGLDVELFESRGRLGGRATSFRDPETGELVDQCQHVGLGCCTNLVDFCRRLGVDDRLRRDRTLHFIGPGGRCREFRAARWLPAPLHLAPALLGLDYLTWSERVAIVRALLRLARLRPEECRTATIGQWLRAQHQSPSAIARFWTPVLVSALSESLDRASLWYARKVFVDGFMATRQGYEMNVPRVPLGDLYGQTVVDWLAQRGVRVRRNTAVRSIGVGQSPLSIEFDGTHASYEFVICAVPWRVAGRLLGETMCLPRERDHRGSTLEPVPITGVHLWFDRPITDLPHAVLIDRTGQWLFRREAPATESGHAGSYYQVVISASREEASWPREDLVRQVCSELATIWPAAASARLLHWRVVTEPEAVFSVGPNVDVDRPATLTERPGLLLAGDWTRTGWPATMEGAVRSGYRAAEAVLQAVGRPERIVLPEPAPGWLARWLIASAAPSPPL